MDNRRRNLLIIMLGLFIGTPYGFGQVENLLVSTSVPETPATAAIAGEGGAGAPEGEAVRDPFWPVGYVPQVVAEEIEEEVEEVAGTGPIDFSGLTPEEQAVIKSTMNVGGILKQNDTCIAMLNNRIMRQGETLSLESGGRKYGFLVKKLTPTKIILESAH